MGLLEDIQNAAVDGRSDLGSILRKCKLLASRLGSKPLEDWLVWESNGYPPEVDVPDYRKWSLQIRGHFAGPFGSQVNYVIVPPVCLPEKTREWVENYECRESVTTLEAALAEVKGHNLQLSPPNLQLIVNKRILPQYVCMQAWAEYGPAHLVELLNTVRNRILDFALALGKEQPTLLDAEDGSVKKGAIDASKVTQIFNTTIHGPTQFVGSASTSAFTLNVGKQDIASLQAFLKANGIEENDRADLRSAVQSEPTLSDGQFGPKVSAWITRMMRKAAEGGLAVAGELLVKAVMNYYGLG